MSSLMQHCEYGKGRKTAKNLFFDILKIKFKKSLIHCNRRSFLNLSQQSALNPIH